MSRTYFQHIACSLAGNDRSYGLSDCTVNPVEECRMTEVRATDHVVVLVTVASSLEIGHAGRMLAPN